MLINIKKYIFWGFFQEEKIFYTNVFVMCFILIDSKEGNEGSQ